MTNSSPVSINSDCNSPTAPPREGMASVGHMCDHRSMAKALVKADKQYRKAARERHESILAARSSGMTLQEIGASIGMGKTGVVMYLKRAKERSD
jgi:hypothetical protein